MEKENEKITVIEAYKAMCNYLENLYGMTKSSDLGGFLGSMALLDDGEPADPAAWEDWIDAIQKTKLEKEKD